MTLIDTLRKTISDAEAQIAKIQKACPHPEISIMRQLPASNADGDRWRWCVCGLCEAEFTRGYDGATNDQPE